MKNETGDIPISYITSVRSSVNPKRENLEEVIKESKTKGEFINKILELDLSHKSEQDKS